MCRAAVLGNVNMTDGSFFCEEEVDEEFVKNAYRVGMRQVG